MTTSSTLRAARMLGLSSAFLGLAMTAARSEDVPATMPPAAPATTPTTTTPTTTNTAQPASPTQAAAPAQAATVDPQVQPAAAAPAAPVYYGDPYGFTNWLNGVRAQYGLGAVGHDPNLSGWAAMNNNHQNAYGMGHHVMGPARRQNSGMGASTTVFQMWMASPAHRAALLDPSITWIGIAAGGAYWTFNAY